MTTQTDAARSTPEAGSVADLYREVLPMLAFTAAPTKIDMALTVAPGDLHDVIAASRDDARLSMDLLRNLTAVDWQDAGIELVYHLYSLRHHHGVCIKARLTGDAPSIATVTDLYMGAEWAEREVREMFGVEFEGHPDPRNLLLDEDLDIHPLLKSHPWRRSSCRRASMSSTSPRSTPRNGGRRRTPVGPPPPRSRPRTRRSPPAT